MIAKIGMARIAIFIVVWVAARSLVEDIDLGLVGLAGIFVI
jgi:hypothetical protein